MRKIEYRTYKRPSNFVKLEQGDNRAKIVSEGYIGYEHGTVKDKKYIPLGPCTQSSVCEHCKKNNQPKLRYKWVVYLPETQEIKVLAVGVEIGDEICQIAALLNKITFEVIINKVGSGKQSKYSVKKVESTEVDGSTLVLIKQGSDYLKMRYLKQ